jgi:hypothetical protein
MSDATPRNDIIINLTDILDRPYSPACPNELDWHLRVTDLLTKEAASRSPEWLQTSRKMLHEYPFNELETELSLSMQNKRTPKHIRRHRKLLMIGRDTLLLAGDDPLPKGCEPIFPLTRSLGMIADTEGKRRRKAAKQAQKHLRKMDIFDSNDVTPINFDLIASRIGSKLHTDVLYYGESAQNEKEFHRFRRDFRQVSHLCIMAYLHNPNNHQLMRLTDEGFALNRTYGKAHNSLLKQAI